MHHGEDLLYAQWLGEYCNPELPERLWVGAVMGRDLFSIYICFILLRIPRFCFLSLGETIIANNKVEAV